LLVLAIALTGGVGACARPPEDGWPAFKAAYIQPDGRVVDPENGGVSHSEGQGWAMLLAEGHGDRQTFEQTWRWTRTHLSRKNAPLLAWRYDPRATPAVADENNAADGDIYVGWALLRAGRRWRDAEYLSASKAIRDAVAERLVVEVGGRTVLLPGLEGFRGPTGVTTNPSYFILPAFQAFAAEDGGASPWRSLIADGLDLARDGRFGVQRLPPDWLLVRADGTLSPAPDKPAVFGFEAVRVPLYLAWGGEDRLAAQTAEYWRAPMQEGKRPPAWVNMSDGRVADFPLSYGGVAIAALALNDTTTGLAQGTPPDRTYYSSALTLLAAMAARERGGKP
jgi:endoglucanase